MQQEGLEMSEKSFSSSAPGRSFTGTGASTPTQNCADQLIPMATSRESMSNMPSSRVLPNRKCIYERKLPGGAYISAHVERLQHGYYNNPRLSDQNIDYVDFLGINFVFHPAAYRFKAATIKMALSSYCETASSMLYPPPKEPKFMMHAPHLMFGTLCPQALHWNFTIVGSVGITRYSPKGNPLSASSAASLLDMVKIQGSSRTLQRDRDFVEDGEVVWTLEESPRQRSGLPHEFTFVTLISKARRDSRLDFSLTVDPVLENSWGTYPSWLLMQTRFQPVTCPIDFRAEIGQRFEPCYSNKGFNFAELEDSFDEFVRMPGSMFAFSVSATVNHGATSGWLILDIGFRR